MKNSITFIQFKTIIEGIQKQIDQGRKDSDLLAQVFEDFQGFQRTPLVDVTIDFLDSVFESEDVSYFIFELDFGRNSSDQLQAPIHIDGQPVPLSTIQDLWNLINK